jgi:putative membrane protein
VTEAKTETKTETKTEIKNLKEQQKRLHHVSEHLANERTMLAWIRTAIAVMTLGVGINRFSLFLVEFSKIVPGGRAVNVHAEELGIALVGLGLAALMGGTWHYLHVARAIDDETYRPARAGIVVLTLAVLALGGTSLVWLLL